MRHSNERVVGCLVAVRVVLAKHIAHHASALDRLGTGVAAEAQAHALHGEEDAPLNRLLAIAHVGQRTALHHAQGVFEIGTLSVLRERDRVVGRCWFVKEIRFFVHSEIIVLAALKA